MEKLVDVGETIRVIQPANGGAHTQAAGRDGGGGDALRMSRVLKLPSSIVADHVDVSCPIPLPIRSHRTADGDHGQLQKSLSSKNGFHPEGEALFNYFNPSMSCMRFIPATK
ncbi:hypothetical protein D5086_006464 [Populus alba]|uniref:Uncharacterized protein n=1 Tax=Populus alba TaxID=43335 RepID=A0ACC4CLF0_POPAL